MSTSSQTNGHEFSRDGIRRINADYTPETIANKRREWKEFVRNMKPYPGTYEGKGIVICAGGFSYLTCAWINIKLLRKYGCRLPVELWHQKGEVSNETIAEFKKLEVTCRTFSDYVEGNVENGYQLKPLAVLHSSFKEILLLDADSNCMRDPAFLFENEIYESSDAVFWPDYWKTEKTNPIWQIVESNEFELPEQESGQVLVNKEKCWKEINLCTFFNFDPFYYEILWGDKDTFKFSWLALKSPFHLIEKRLAAVGFRTEEFGFGSVAMAQHDFSGEILFIHSNLLKWDERDSKERFWREIRRLELNSAQTIDMKYHPHFESYFLKIEGDGEMLTEEDSIAQLEKECLFELEKLRRAEFYSALQASVK